MPISGVQLHEGGHKGVNQGMGDTNMGVGAGGREGKGGRGRDTIVSEEGRDTIVSGVGAGREGRREGREEGGGEIP